VRSTHASPRFVAQVTSSPAPPFASPTRTAPDAAASKCCTKASGVRSATTAGTIRMLSSPAGSWDEGSCPQAALHSTEKGSGSFGWTMWRALARRRTWRAVRAPDGEAITVAIARMPELAALDPSPAQLVCICSRGYVHIQRSMDREIVLCRIHGGFVHPADKAPRRISADD
jgi:hypothetical protein